uniref:Uncharacterized protein n=1 Tax=Pithovirus LCPAC001 TaxID=2506585 RepID=A0A481Z1U9_9VIRU|nr:MAG: hypothetical protein LCPAC001_01430 [Pithovirus LCPAC001]
MAITFLKLVQQHFQNNPKFDLDSHLEFLIDNDRYCEDGDNTEWDAIAAVLPESKVLIDKSEYNIIYHRECEANSKRVYQYKDYYITTFFEGDGDDIDITSFTNNYKNGLMGFYETCVKVYTKKEFDVYTFIKKSGNVDQMIEIYKNFNKKEGLKKLQSYFKQYIADKWNKSD